MNFILLNVLNSNLPKMFIAGFSFNKLTWTKSSSGMYYSIQDINRDGVNKILSVCTGDWVDIRPSDVITFGIIGDKQIIINSTTNSFGTNTTYQAVILYV